MTTIPFRRLPSEPPPDLAARIEAVLPGATAAESAALCAALSKFVGPARPGEPAGEAAAVAAFRSARQISSPRA
ncbi:MAG: hypothetical protein ACT4PP_16185 [Sporichthyaceae bacterium]